MRLNRVHCDQSLATGTEIDLPEGAARHVARVLRLRPGATIVAFDGSGHDFTCEITSVAGDAVRVRIGERSAGLRDSPLGITLVQAVSRGERMDWTLQKATELGVRAIVPVLSARCVVRLDEQQAERRLRHWKAVVAGACEQCGRSTVPEVRAPVELDRYLAQAPREGRRLVLSPDGPASLAGLASTAPRVELLIGPEGGLDGQELDAAGRAGFSPVRLGPRVLRTETAGIVALAVLQALWGDLQ
ncbi:MAG TPA: 16S rRNA (uracil(1498)-N(3))-methyltransferase [Steroidobacteraceae bacterium]|nr:16S rRNA (uracil(1498)-N(3))-methyltransferase [Steroidobacteraceae bacterium]